MTRESDLKEVANPSSPYFSEEWKHLVLPQSSELFTLKKKLLVFFVIFA